MDTSPNNKQFQWSRAVWHASVVIGLTALFGFLYFFNHAWGAWGDDSPGYIFLAGRMHQEQPLVYNDPLATEGMEFFGDHRVSNWLIPTHHEFISPDGDIASKYPIGSSQLMYFAALLGGSSDGFYLVTPTLAVVNVLLLYLLTQLFFRKNRFSIVIGCVAALSMGLSNLYFEHAVAQPMREIPSITFLLLSAIFFTCALFKQQKKQLILAAVCTVLSGAAFGMAINIRETSLVIVPAFFFFGVIMLWQAKKTVIFHLKKLTPFIGIFLVGLLVGVLPTIINSYTISKNKEAFKARDTSGIAIFSNDNHIQSLSVQNIFDNQGKFAVGEGSLPHYWDVMQHFSPLPYFLFFVAYGAWFLWKRDRWGKGVSMFLLLWSFATLSLFSLWINPYGRYSMPVLPPFAMLAAIGAYGFVTVLLPQFFSSMRHVRTMQIVVSVCIAFTFVASYIPFAEKIQREVKLDPPYMRFKSMTYNDLQQLKSIGEKIRSDDTTTQSLVLFSGQWQYGTSETFAAHTGVHAIRSPFEQRAVADREQIITFLEKFVLSQHATYMWIDSTTSQKTYTWFEQQKSTLIGEYDFSFQENVRLYLIEPNL